jgi:putative glutamine amidotransferase
MTRPILGFICCRRVLMIGGKPDPAQAVMERYIHGVSAYVGAIPVLIPSLPDLVDARAVMARLDGLLLTGSPSNMEPARYGGESPGEGPFDPDRDAMSQALIGASLELSKPVFGICRGFQEMNVYFGGTLRGDLSTPGRALEHHSPEAITDLPGMFAHRHPVMIEHGGLLESALGHGEISVNSVHFQGVDRLADGVTVEARAPDGVVEAFSKQVGDTTALAVQWHPEWEPQADPNALKLFGLMGQILQSAR